MKYRILKEKSLFYIFTDPDGENKKSKGYKTLAAAKSALRADIRGDD